MKINTTILFLAAATVAAWNVPAWAQTEETETEEVDFATQIVGVWTIDIEKTREAQGNDTFDSPTVEMEYDKDGRATMTIDGVASTARYSMEAIEGSVGVFKMVSEVDSRTRETTLTFHDKDTVQIELTNGIPVVFNRKSKTYSLDEANAFLVGQWQIDAQATRELADNDGVPAELPEISLKFRDNGLASAGVDGRLASGGFELSGDGGEGEFRLETNIDNDKKVFTFKIIDADRFQVQPADSFAMVFRRIEE